MLVDDYIDHRRARGELAESSIVTVRPILHQWHHHAGPLHRWTGELAAGWVHEQHLRPNSRKGRLSRLRPYCRWLVRHGHLAHDITLDVPSVKVPPPNPRDLPAASVAQLLAVCPDDRARLVVTLMVQCGLRCVDLSRVLIEDIDAARQTLAVRAKGGRGEVTHTVPIPSEAWVMLTSYLAGEGRWCGPLIANAWTIAPRPISANRISVLVRRWVAAAGLKAFPHDGVSAHALRHSCAQGMLDGGASLREIQFALGHRHQTTTEVYLRREPPGLRAAMDGRRYLAAG